ncbi:transcriptional regulator, IclR family (plasmid) [Paraburkholderia caribensis MBA4]|uniref:Transcriptional regulator, IclR family n=1 Tax=Paraburkholderia caribensis MBA4 TaxID=1323664 RepID=A0A0P0RQB7_9BURK|nr:IclR family transcriptional regulator [Paraburkholderia caribensis]ALL71132.1 transcriptional regulator, IclR family [Paraburkholderia caribensis MBA4]
MMNTDISPIPGAQSAHRVLGLLTLLAQNHEAGIKLSELVSLSGLDRATAYRLVSTLVQTLYADRDEVTKRYRLGIRAMQVGLAAMSRVPLLELVRHSLHSLARTTEDTVFLVVRNGDYAHCIHVEHGPFPIRVVTMLVGNIRLLGLGTAGRALLATMDDAEFDALFMRHRTEFEQKGVTRAALRKSIAQTRQNGFSVEHDLVVEGVSAVGVSFVITDGSYAAISIAGLRSRMDAKRRQWMAGLVRDEMGKLGFEVSRS